MNAYAAREQERRRRVLDAAARQRDDRQTAARLHADAVINKYMDAVTTRYGAERAATIQASHDPATGWYHVNGKAMREQVLTDAAAFMYASAHAAELSASIPDDDR